MNTIRNYRRAKVGFMVGLEDSDYKITLYKGCLKIVAYFQLQLNHL